MKKSGVILGISVCLVLMFSLSIVSAGFWETITGQVVGDGFERGDVTKDTSVDVGDFIYLSQYILNNGPSPEPMELGDINADGEVDIGDINYLSNYLYKDGPAPVPFNSGFSVGVGDANTDGGVNVGDLVFLLNYLYKEGDAPNPLAAGDANKDGNVDIGDIIYLINYLYKDGPAPGAEQVQKECTDTDGGLDYFEKGISGYIKNGVPDFKEETCNYYGDPNTLGEYYCDTEGLRKISPYVCPNGCQEGRCIVVSGTKRGDINGDTQVNIGDFVFLTNYIFKEGLAPNPLMVADVNGDKFVDVGDVVYLSNYLFKNGPAPVAYATATPIESPCTDTDGGLDYFEKGKASILLTEEEDLCVDEYTIKESYCDFTGELKTFEFSCPEKCVEGVCIRVEEELTSCSGIFLPSGDANGDGFVDVGDFVYLNNYVFKNGPTPNPLKLGDANGDGNVNNGDIVYLVNYLYKEGVSPIGESIVGPSLKPKTRVKIGTVVKYCDPLTLGYLTVKNFDESCLEDYECGSNVCIDSKCTSIRKELERQGTLLKQIWCALINPVDVLKRNNAGEDVANNDYLSCLVN